LLAAEQHLNGPTKELAAALASLVPFPLHCIENFLREADGNLSDLGHGVTFSYHIHTIV
jgi:hypothetical protein